MAGFAYPMTRCGEILGAHCDHVRGPDGQPLLRTPSSWQGLVVERREIPSNATCGPQHSGMPVIALCRSGRGVQWHRSGKVVRKLYTIPSSCIAFGAGYERDSGRWEGEAGASITVRMPSEVLQRFLKEEALGFDLANRFERNDRTLERIVLSLADEVSSGLPNGTLYADGLCLSLLGWLSRHYSAFPVRVAQSRRLAPVEVRRVREFIESHLHDSLTIDDMAKSLDLSASHFARLFQRSLGVAPHRYVLEKRVARAAQLLRNEPRRPIADIAISCGFSSQAHLSVAFKRVFQATPARWRIGG